MAVRAFDGSSRIELGLGTVATMNTGACTLLILAKRTSDTGDYMATVIGHTGSGRRGLATFNPNDLTMMSGGAVVESTQPWLTADDWCVVGFSKAAGSATPTLHHLPLGGSWTHTAGGGTIGDDVTPLDTSIVIGQQDESFGFIGRMAVGAIWLDNLADAAIEALNLDVSIAGWLTADGAWGLNQATTADPVLDLTGNGADQTLLMGTTVVEGDDPPGFSFAASTAGAGVAFGGGFATADTAKLATGTAVGHGSGYGSATPAKVGLGQAVGVGGALAHAATVKVGDGVGGGFGTGAASAQATSIRRTRAVAAAGGLGFGSVTRTAPGAGTAYGGGYGADTPAVVVVPGILTPGFIRPTLTPGRIRPSLTPGRLPHG